MFLDSPVRCGAMLESPESVCEEQSSELGLQRGEKDSHSTVRFPSFGLEVFFECVCLCLCVGVGACLFLRVVECCV